jgi:hypothetical protein
MEIMIWIGSSYNFSYILVLFGWKKFDKLAWRAILAASSSLENWFQNIPEPF